MNIKKFFKKQKLAIGIVIGALVFTGLPVLADGGSIIDLIVNRTAQVVGNHVNQKLDESGVLDNITKEDLTLGAVPGNEIQDKCFKVGGVEKCYVLIDSLNAATTTLAVLKNPFTAATSTLEQVVFQINTGTTTASTIVFATSTSPYSTSSNPFMTGQAVASGAQASISWLPATGVNDGEALISPGVHVLIKTEGAGLGGYTYKGKAFAVFTKF